MASLHLDPPSSFDFKHPNKWPSWKWQFEQFRLALGFASESDERQVSMLLYCMGEEAEGIFASTNISAEDKKKYNSVIAKFYTFFKVRKISYLSVPILINGDRERMNQLNSSLQVYTSLQIIASMGS